MKFQFNTLQKIKGIIIFYMIALLLAGFTAFPIEWELKTICGLIERIGNDWISQLAIVNFIYEVKDSIVNINTNSPYISYGFDWLAFAHIVIALLFIGPYKDPIRNKWVIYWGMIACVGIFPLAFICGPIRSIPLYWTFIDCSFGFFGIFPLLLCIKYIHQLEKEQNSLPNQ